MEHNKEQQTKRVVRCSLRRICAWYMVYMTFGALVGAGLTGATILG